MTILNKNTEQCAIVQHYMYVLVTGSWKANVMLASTRRWFWARITEVLIGLKVKIYSDIVADTFLEQQFLP